VNLGPTTRHGRYSSQDTIACEATDLPHQCDSGSGEVTERKDLSAACERGLCLEESELRKKRQSLDDRI
jgi:hypothetical protein